MADSLLAELLAAETGVWQALNAGDAEADAAVLAPEFIGVYPDGIAGADIHAGQLDDGPTIADYALSQARAMAVGEGHGLLVYHVRYLRAGKREWEAMYVSSLWRREAAGWRNLFSQDTPVGAAVP